MNGSARVRRLPRSPTPVSAGEGCSYATSNPALTLGDPSLLQWGAPAVRKNPDFSVPIPADADSFSSLEFAPPASGASMLASAGWDGKVCNRSRVEEWCPLCVAYPGLL